MNDRAYYNEHDAFAAAWLRALIEAGELPAGDVDERSIEDVVPAELAGYTQRHFFAGIGGWAYALRLSGWPDDRPVWTGSCPCQPFSTAGKGAGFADERHLWPAWQWLIAQCRPQRIYGEQVASGSGLVWLDLVSTDLEALGYACTAVDLPSASVGGTDIRQRLWWMADAECRRSGARRAGRASGRAPLESHRHGPARGLAHDHQDGRGGLAASRLYAPGASGHVVARCGDVGRVGDARFSGGGRDAGAVPRAEATSGREGRADWCVVDEPEYAGVPCRMADPEHAERRALDLDREDGRHRSDGRRTEAYSFAGTRGEVCYPWADAEWIPCRDGKWRPVEPGTFPLAHGIPGRVGRLRGYGNAINPWVAAAFIRATAPELMREGGEW